MNFSRDIAMQRLYIGFEIIHLSFSRPQLGNALFSIADGAIAQNPALINYF